MGTFRVGIAIGDPEGRRWETLDALVDPGASYTWIPRGILERLGVRPLFRREFETADGRITELDMAETRTRLDGQERTTLVVFGYEGSLPLLGAYTMEGFGVAPDPVNQRMVRVRGLAMLSVCRR